MSLLKPRLVAEPTNPGLEFSSLLNRRTVSHSNERDEIDELKDFRDSKFQLDESEKTGIWRSSVPVGLNITIHAQIRRFGGTFDQTAEP